VRFGILQRYVLGEVLRAFGLSLLTITCIFVLLTVMTTAASIGLSPAEILQLVPYMIPRSLPYTVPVSLLFAATVVYGRLASDNEVIAVKTAGLNAMVLIWPSILVSLVLSVILSVASARSIPESNAAAKKVIYQNLEDFFYKMLKKDRTFDVPTWPFKIEVADVEGRVMIKPHFKKRSDKPVVPLALPIDGEQEAPAAYDMVIVAKTAQLKFDLEHSKVRIFFEDANISRAGDEPAEGTVRSTWFDFDVPGNGIVQAARMLDEMTVEEMREREAEYRENIALERKRQAVAAAMWVGSGRLNGAKWADVQSAFAKYDFWGSEINKFETEIQVRLAMAWGSLFFVVLGAPVGIIFARRDFLSAFISCFMPIIMVYYPLILFGTNLGKEGLVPPLLVWAGNGVLWAAAWFWALPPIRQH